MSHILYRINGKMSLFVQIVLRTIALNDLKAKVGYVYENNEDVVYITR